MASRVSYARDTFSRPLLYLFVATISSYLSIFIYIYSYVTKIKRGCWKRIEMLYRAKKQQFINISYHRRLKSLTKLWREKMKGARKKKKERERIKKRKLSRQRLEQHAMERGYGRSDPPRAILSSICQVENDATQTSEKPLTRGTVDTSKGLRLGQQVVL